MPTQTKFLCPSGGVNVDFSGIFEELNGGTQYGSATNFKVGSSDINTLFHASTSTGDRLSFNTGYKIGSNDLSTIFRRRGFVGINITTQPTNQVVVNNSTATFSIAATAAGTPTYQWYKNSSLISGATSTTYTTGALTTANDTDSYFCRVSYNGSSIDSDSVNTRIKPYIITHPSGGSFNDGNVISLSIVAGGSATLFYQWFKDGNLISGATSAAYPSFQLTSATKGTYTCKVTSTHDNVGITSNGAALTIIPPVVSIGITGYSAPYIFNYNTAITLSSSLSQGTNVTYQWYGPNGLISGATGATYIFSLSGSTDGNYYVIATNDGGSSTSNTVAVYVNPYITTNPSNDTVIAGGNAVFTVAASGSGTLTYQWYRNGSPIGASDPSFADIGVTSAYNGYTYYCIVSSSISGTTQATSTTATLTVNYAPTIGSTQFNGSTLASDPDAFGIGNGESFTIEISSVDDGNPNATGSWYKWDGSNYISLGVSAYSHTLSQDDNSTDYYRYQLSNAYGTVYSYQIMVVTS